MDADAHIDLVERGVAFHEARRYQDALPLLRSAYDLAPTCPDVVYNLANTLHMLDCEQEAFELLQWLLEADDDQIRKGCPAGRMNPASYRVDAYYLAFLVVLYGTEDWDDAYEYAKEHLRRRRRGLRSLWTRREVLEEIQSLRQEFAGAT